MSHQLLLVWGACSMQLELCAPPGKRATTFIRLFWEMSWTFMEWYCFQLKYGNGSGEDTLKRRCLQSITSLDCNLFFSCMWKLYVLYGQLIYCVHDSRELLLRCSSGQKAQGQGNLHMWWNRVAPSVGHDLQYLAGTINMPFCDQAWDKERPPLRTKSVESLIDGRVFN